MIQKDISLSNDHSEFDDNVFEDDSFCKKDDDQSFLLDNQLYKPTKRVDDRYHHPRSQSGSESFYYKPRSSKFQSSNKIPKLFDLPGTDAAYKSPTSFASQSGCSLHFSDTHTSNRNTWTTYDLRPKPIRNYCFFLIHQLLLRINYRFHENWTEKRVIEIESSWLELLKKICGNIHESLFLVHHRLYPLYFEFKTLLFILEIISTLWKSFNKNWTRQPRNKCHSSTLNSKTIWIISQLIPLIQIFPNKLCIV